MSSSGGGAWDDSMIVRYNNAVARLGGNQNLIKEIAIELGKGKVKKGA
ncbi:unnamed protein product [Brassica rapa subsp. trilocularis]